MALYKLAVVGGPTGIRVLGIVAALALVAVTTVVTRAVAGERAARIAAVLSAGLASSIALASVYTPSELLAAVPAAGSIGCLVAAHRRGQARWLVGAGLLAVAAALIKQSFLDAGFAGAVFLIASSVRDRRPRLRWAAAYAAGALIPVAGVGVWLAVAHVSPGSLVYALFGFRVHALDVLATSNVPLHVRLKSLWLPGAGSGLFVAARHRAPRARDAARRPRARRHARGLARRRRRRRARRRQLLAALPDRARRTGEPAHRRGAVARSAPAAWSPPRSPRVAVVGTVGGVGQARALQQRHGVVAVASYVRDHARPGDTQYVMYARANVGYYTGLPSPYPYAWSLLVRAHPGATARLRQLLESPRRPTWIVGWQRPSRWGLDPGGATARALHAHYRVVAHVHGHPIYHRTSSPRSHQ